MNARSAARFFAVLAWGGELDRVRLLSEERVRLFRVPRPPCDSVGVLQRRAFCLNPDQVLDVHAESDLERLLETLLNHARGVAPDWQERSARRAEADRLPTPPVSRATLALTIGKGGWPSSDRDAAHTAFRVLLSIMTDAKEGKGG